MNNPSTSSVTIVNNYLYMCACATYTSQATIQGRLLDSSVYSKKTSHIVFDFEDTYMYVKAKAWVSLMFSHTCAITEATV